MQSTQTNSNYTFKATQHCSTCRCQPRNSNIYLAPTQSSDPMHVPFNPLPLFAQTCPRSG